MIPDWKDAWKWLSIQAATITAVIGALQATLPYFQNLMTPQQFGWLTAACGIITIWARLIPQGKE